MNWLDSASLSSLATSAFKTAQKKIDKMLEIQEGEGTFDDEMVRFQEPQILEKVLIETDKCSNAMIKISAIMGDDELASLPNSNANFNDFDETLNDEYSLNNLPLSHSITQISPKADNFTGNVDTIDACPIMKEDSVSSSADFIEKLENLDDAPKTNNESVEAKETIANSASEYAKIEELFEVPPDPSMQKTLTSEEDVCKSPVVRKSKAFVMHSVSHSAALFQDDEIPPSTSHPDLAFSVVNAIDQEPTSPHLPDISKGEIETESDRTDVEEEEEEEAISEDGKSRTATNYSSDIEILSLPTTHPPSSICSLCSDIPEEDYHAMCQNYRKTQALWAPPNRKGNRGIFLQASEWAEPCLDILFPPNEYHDVYNNLDGKSKGGFKYKLSSTGPIMNTMHPPLATHQKSGGQSSELSISTEIALAALPVQSPSFDMSNEERQTILPDEKDIAAKVLPTLTKDANPDTIIKAREEQILKLFKENLSLKEELTKREHNLGVTKLTNESEDLQKQIDTLNEEFGRRIAEAEKKLLSATRERDNLKKQLKKQELDDNSGHGVIDNQPASNKSGHSQDSNGGGAPSKSFKKGVTFEVSQLSKTLTEKEQIIKELMEEGNKLAKQQLGNSALIKKLRGREKELETNLTTQTKKNEELMTEISKLEDSMSRKEAVERDHSDLLQQASADLILRADKIAELESTLLETTEKCKSMETALESAYKEIGTLHKSLADKNNALEEAEKTLSEGIEKAVADARVQLEKVDEEKRKSLYQEISELQHEVLQLTKSHKQREQNHQREIDDLRQGLKSSEARCQDLSQNISYATQPLVRQIDELQQLLNAQKGADQLVEQNLRLKLREAENSTKIAEEKEKQARTELEKEIALSKTLRISIQTLQREKEELISSLKSTQISLDQVNCELKSLREEIEKERTEFGTELDKLKSENHSLKETIEVLNSKIAHRVNQLHDKESDHNKRYRKRERIKRYSSTDSYDHTSASFDAESIGEWESNMAKSERKISIPQSTFNDEDGFSNAEGRSRVSPLSITPTNLSDRSPSIVNSPSATTIHSNNAGVMPVFFEKLEFQLKVKEGELHQLQGEMHKLERSRESMAHELVNLTSRCDVLARVESELEALKAEYGELNKRYNTVLQMYGEKAEEADELRMDLQDLKTSYRNQMEILIPSSAPNKC